MKHSIFSRLLTAFIMLLIISFIITGSTMYFFLDRFILSNKTEEMLSGANHTSKVFESYVKNAQTYKDIIPGALLQSNFEYNIELVSYISDSTIWIVDCEGHIIYSYPAIPSDIINEYSDYTGSVLLPDTNQYTKIMSTDKDYITETGNFYGFFKHESFQSRGEDWHTIEKKYEIKTQGSQDNIVYAVYIHTPVPELRKAKFAIFRLLLFAILAAVLISVFLVYFFSKKISNPLKEISKTAKIISNGDFEKKLDIHTGDEIEQLADSFNHMITALENLEQMRKDFIANVSHDLRTPVTTISGFIQGIIDGTIPREKHDYYLKIVLEETQRLNRLVNDLLILAKIEAGQLSFKPESFNINELTRRVIIMLEKQIINKNINIHANFEKETTYVFADRDSIERVLYNLMHNAVKFTPENGQITIEVSTQKDKAYISVSDTGIGIDKKELSMIWERFYKTDKSRGQDKTGTGIGLSIIKNIINLHRQEIWAESETGKGTKFIFTLKKG